MDDFEFKAANDDYDKSIEPFENFDDLAAALIDHFEAVSSFPDLHPPEETMRSVIQRTNSISALVELERRLKGKSLTNLVTEFIDDLLKPSSIEVSPEQQYQNIQVDQCVDSVLGETLLRFLNPPPFISEELAAKWNVPLTNYLRPERMKEEIRKNRSEIIKQISTLEILFDVLRQESRKRVELLHRR